MRSQPLPKSNQSALAKSTWQSIKWTRRHNRMRLWWNNRLPPPPRSLRKPRSFASLSGSSSSTMPFPSSLQLLARRREQCLNLTPVQPFSSLRCAADTLASNINQLESRNRPGFERAHCLSSSPVPDRQHIAMETDLPPAAVSRVLRRAGLSRTKDIASAEPVIRHEHAEQAA